MGKVIGCLSTAGKVRMRTKLALKDKKRKKVQGRAKKRLLYNIRFLGKNNCLKFLVENKKRNTNITKYTRVYEDIPNILYLKTILIRQL